MVGGTEFSTVRFGGDAAQASRVYDRADPLQPEDVADAVHWAASRPARVNINAIELMPVNQSFGPLAIHRDPPDAGP
jgi:3-hydroxy acid dehydrogenase/malonic semialdehyde reductase